MTFSRVLGSLLCTLSWASGAPQVAWPLTAHGGWPHSQRRPLRSAGIRQSANGVTSPSASRTLASADMKACKIDTDTWEDAAGDPCPLETEGEARDRARRQWERAQGGGQKGPQETQRCFNNQHTHRLHLMPCLQQGLPIADWPLQPHKTLQLCKNRGLNLF